MSNNVTSEWHCTSNSIQCHLMFHCRFALAVSLLLSDGNGIFIPRPLQQTKEMQKNSQLNILNVILAAGPVENLQYPVSVDPI